MQIKIMSVLLSHPILMGSNQVPGYRISFESDIVAGQAIFVPASTLAEQLLEQQYFVEMDYEGIESFRIWTQPDPPTLMIRPLDRPGDYELVAAVEAITSLNDTENQVVVDVVVGDIAFAFSADEICGAVPRVGDVISCTVRALSLWDAAL
jgi:hypothetical protein